VRRPAGDVLAGVLDAARSRPDHASDGVEDGGLACAVGADEGDEGAGFSVEGDAADSLDLAIGDHEVLHDQDGRAHAGSA